MTAVMLERPTEAGVALFPENAGISPFLLDLMRRIDMEPTFKSERGLLYSFRGKQQQPDEYGGALKQLQYEVLIKDETVTLRNITETCGTNKSGKIYRSWKTDRILNFSLKAERHGHRVLRVYEQITRTKKFRGSFTNSTARHSSLFNSYVPTDFFEVENIPSEYSNLRADPSIQYVSFTLVSWAFYQILRQIDPTNPAFGAMSFSDTASYPVFQLFPKSVFNIKAIRESVPKNYSLHSEPDVKKFITKVFGPEGVRKDMVKAVLSTTDINSIFLAARLKHLFPLDWLRDFVQSPDSHMIYDNTKTYTEGSVQGLVALLSSLTVPQRKRLLVEKIPARHGLGLRHTYLIRDSIQMFSDLNPEQKEEYGMRIDYSSWHNLHETLVQISNEIRAKEKSTVSSRRFDLEGTYMEKLRETSYEVEGETYKLFAPRNGYDLTKWGNEMHNCIGSYRRQVDDKGTNVFAVHHNGELFANVEINTRGGIVQHMQKYNTRSPLEHFEALRLHIEAVDEAIKKKAADAKRIENAQRMRRTRMVEA
jgi:hypothetical protein